MSIREWLRTTEFRLRENGVESPFLEAQVLACHVLRVERSYLFAHPDHDFPDLAGEALLQRRLGHEPLAYIVGHREFYGRMFTVNKHVLIPRQDTETLVEAALRALPKGARVLDVGTGSGCVGITLKLERPDLQVTAIDVSKPAIAVAAGNAADLGANVQFRESDLFEAVDGERFDAIVTNPPYIGRDEPLLPEVRDFEPGLALYGGAQGNEFLRRLAAEGKDVLEPTGLLITEIGYRQLAACREAFHEAGWLMIEFARDLSGNDRVVVFTPST